MQLEDRLNLALEAGKEAGRILHDFYVSGNYDIYNKKGSFHEEKFTDADIESNKVIESLVTLCFPDDGFLSEESPDDPSKRMGKDYCWIVDPMDGTHEFIKKGKNFGVSIALAYKGEVKIWVIVIPERNKTYHAIRGGGAFCNGEKIVTGNSNKDIKDSIMIGSKNEYKSTISPYLRDLYDKLDVKEKKFLSTHVYKMMRIVERKAHIYPSFFNTSEWDIAAGHMLLEESGKSITSLNGSPIRYNNESPRVDKGMLVSCFDKEKHEELVKLILPHLPESYL